MSFLQNYLERYQLNKMSDKEKKDLTKLESHVKNFVKSSPGPLSFEDCLQQYGYEMADLVERLSIYLNEMPSWSLSTVIDLFRFIYNISVEIHQIVEEMSSCVMTDDMSDQERHITKIQFGQELVYFIWMIVDPLRDKFTWLPFKKVIVKKVIFWLSGIALKSTVDLFAAQGFQSMSAHKQFIKAIP